MIIPQNIGNAATLRFKFGKNFMGVFKDRANNRNNKDETRQDTGKFSAKNVNSKCD